MDNTKLIRQMKRFEAYLMVDRGLAKVTAGGYCRAVSIALRRMKKFVPKYQGIKTYIGWMYNKGDSSGPYASIGAWLINAA